MKLKIFRKNLICQAYKKRERPNMSMDSDRITRHFISIENNRQIHYRKAGKGPPVLLLHQSPKSSKELTPVIDGLKKNFTCIAPDTPGNGNSDPLTELSPTMIDYGKNIKLFFMI